MTTTNTNIKTNKAITEALQDKKNWENKGKDAFQAILENVLIEVEEDIAKDEKKHSVDKIELDSETNAEINKLLSEDADGFEGNSFGTNEESETINTTNYY